MFSIQTFSARFPLGLLALLTIAPAARAESIDFRNDTTVTLTVYASCVARGVIMRATPVQLQPKQVSPALNPPGTKVIDIQAARFPGRILSRGTTPASDDDRHYSIVPD